jgi:hypothetical protein
MRSAAHIQFHDRMPCVPDAPNSVGRHGTGQPQSGLAQRPDAIRRADRDAQPGSQLWIRDFVDRVAQPGLASATTRRLVLKPTRQRSGPPPSLPARDKSL